mmetsp:Transcript_16466/g.40149  ORF Transcript_16466/g.40149 Transcript_16466/m.40149 type:complete len:179 (+) Transcript_16466:225-761(+)
MVTMMRMRSSQSCLVIFLLMCFATVESKDGVEASVLNNLRRSLSSSTEQGKGAAAVSAPDVDLVLAGVFLPPTNNNQRQLQSEEEQLRALQMDAFIECNEVGEECLELLNLEPDELFIGIQPGFCACITFDCVDNWLNDRIDCGLFDDESSSTRSVPESETAPESETDPDPQLSDILV